MSDSRELVSIVTPLYNNREFLRRTADCVFNQTYSNWEWIVVDDASTDGSVEHFEDLTRSCKKVRVLRNDVNRGITKTTQRGIELANGSILKILDSDDWMHPLLIERTVEAMEANPNAALVFSHAFYLDDQDNIWGGWSKGGSWTKPGLEVFRSQIIKYTIRTSAVSYRVSIINEIGGRDTLPLVLSSDKYFDLRAMLLGDVVYIDEPLGAHRSHQRNSSGRLDLQFDADFIEQRFALYDDLISRLPEDPGFSVEDLKDEAQLMIRAYVVGLLKEAQKRGDKEAVELLVEALAKRGLNPTGRTGDSLVARAFKVGTPFLKLLTKRKLPEMRIQAVDSV
jgi:glycosyltransferase involved in cell wall biosynthesis